MTMTMKRTSWETFGNVVHVANLVNAIVFAVTVVHDGGGRSSSSSSWVDLDPVWKKDGFCVANADTPYWTSHDLCLYADVLLALVVGAVYWALRKEPHMAAANDLIRFNVWGVIGHGIGHGNIAAGIRAGLVVPNTDDDTTTTMTTTGYDVMQGMSFSELIRVQAPFLLFWIMLLRASMTKASWGMVFVVSIVSILGGLMVPTQFGFTYVQTVLFVAFDLNELSKPRAEKGFEYAMYPLMVGLPLGMVGWIESTMCSSGVMDAGGHLIYDVYIPLSMLAFYLLCYFSSPSFSSSSSIKMKKVL